MAQVSLAHYQREIAKARPAIERPAMERPILTVVILGLALVAGAVIVRAWVTDSVTGAAYAGSHRPVWSCAPEDQACAAGQRERAAREY
jgi:hypothetical protein